MDINLLRDTVDRWLLDIRIAWVLFDPTTAPLL